MMVTIVTIISLVPVNNAAKQVAEFVKFIYSHTWTDGTKNLTRMKQMCLHSRKLQAMDFNRKRVENTMNKILNDENMICSLQLKPYHLYAWVL